MLPSHRVLLVGERGVILYGPKDSGVNREISVAWEAKDFSEKLVHAFGSGAQPVVLLLNDASHTYRKEENISPADCQKSLEKAFPDVFARAWMETGRSGAGTGSYLLVALPESWRFNRLGDALSAAHAHVMGCGVLPIESIGLVNTLAKKLFAKEKKKSRWAALVGQHETGGLRQVVTKDGLLALTRITPVMDKEIKGEAWAANMVQEFKATQGYLKRFGLEEKDGLDLVVVCGAAEKKLIGPWDVPGTRMRCVTLKEALKLLGCRAPRKEDNHFADALHAAWAERSDTLTLPIQMPFLDTEGMMRH
ncbi:MAG: hypothetical protein EPN97_09995 [Alphaproteobacteria bacterium]|nr:MAG: hypothetical protein EPN97_09995 [Alphaproteobacteria bacterium]